MVIVVSTPGIDSVVERLTVVVVLVVVNVIISLVDAEISDPGLDVLVLGVDHISVLEEVRSSSTVVLVEILVVADGQKGI